MEIGRPERQAGYAPLVQVMFDFMKAPIGTMELSGGLEVSPVDVERGVVYLDIFLMMTESPGGVRGSLGYRSDLFTSDTIANVVGTYCTILEQCVDDPQTRLSHFQLRGTLLPGSRRTGLHENNLAMAITSTFTPPRTRTEELLTGVWGEVLGLKQVGVHDNFFELGGDSFLIAELISRLREARQIELPPRCVFEAPTVAALAEVLDAMDHAGSSLAVIVPDLKAEAALDSTIHPIGAPVQRVAEPTSIFLTGATGFLGAYVLHELLQQTRADIYCLVRSTDVEEGRKRLQGHLESYALWDSYLGSRVIPVVGDLAQPHLGLSREKFQLMASEIDIIYHTGAQVNFINPYSALKATNVLGTQEILKLATHGKTKPVHYISTLGVFYAGSYSGSKVVREYDDPDDCEGLALGYTQSKWVAEKLMTIARDRGLPVFVYRPAVIIGDSQKGIWNVSDIMCRLIRAFIQLESAPDLDATLDLTPVDYVSRAIVYLSRQKGSPGKTFHITNPKPLHWGQLIDFVRSFGYPLQKVSFAQWQAELKNRHDGFDKNALYPLLSLFYEVLFAGRRSVEGTPVPTRMPEFDCQNTLEGLAGTPIICPQIDAELIGTYLGYLTRCGFLNSPAHRS
jgi:thioester reductase-like protein